MKNMKLANIILGSLVIILALATSAARAETWTVDPDHSAAHFSITHMMIAQVRGMFPGIKGTIEFDDGKPVAFDITIDVDSLDTGVEARDTHLKSDDFFAAATYPVMTFQSMKVFPAKYGYRVAGIMTIKSGSHNVELAISGLTDPRVDPWGNTRRGATAVFNLDRRDYGIDWNVPLDGGGLMVGNEVQIAVDLEILQPK